jgi:predicted outer membrane repeat protein
LTMNRSRQGLRLRLEYLEDRSVPAVFSVNSPLDQVIAGDGKLSLREAINAANAAPGADTIVLPAGVFKITTPGPAENNNATGDFDITDAVTIQGAGAGITIVDGQQLDRVFDVIGNGPSSIKAVMQGMTVRGGNAAGSGGGVQFHDSDLVVRDCVFAGNRADENGGGISDSGFGGGGQITLVRTTLVRNSSTQTGGGVTVGNPSSGLTVRKCTMRQNAALGAGGAIHADSLTMNDSTVKGNWSLTLGGGVSANDATLTNCIIVGNTASASGGGVRTLNSATLTNCIVSGNSCVGEGGGINSVDELTLTSCTVSGNSSTGLGGGLRASTADISKSTISGNFANTGGGGVRANTATLTATTLSGNRANTEGGGLYAVTAELTRCTVNGNSAGGAGGGVYATTAFMTNTTVSGNAASGSGGGLIANSGELLNCTVVENTGNIGGGVVHQVGGVLAVRNTIIALNLTPGSFAPDIFGAFTSGGHNLIGNGSDGTGFTHGVNGDLEGDAVSPIDPKLAPLANNGGKTKTHALKAGSLAVDAGDNANTPVTDQRSLPRVKDGNGDGVARVDIGAFER